MLEPYSKAFSSLLLPLELNPGSHMAYRVLHDLALLFPPASSLISLHEFSMLACFNSQTKNSFLRLCAGAGRAERDMSESSSLSLRRVSQVVERDMNTNTQITGSKAIELRTWYRSSKDKFCFGTSIWW